MSSALFSERGNTLRGFWEYLRFGIGRPPGTMWAVEKSFFKWRYKQPGRPENFYLKMVLRTRYLEKSDDFVLDIAQRCRTLDDAIIEAIRVDFGELVARKFKPAFELFPPCSMCGRYRALSTRDTLCYGCREFGHLIPCHKCHLYWDHSARFCRNCGSPLVSTLGTEVNRAGTSRTANSQEQEPSIAGEDAPTNPPANFPSVPLPRSTALSDELVYRAVTLAVAGIWGTVREHDISATVLDVVGALAKQGIRSEELAYRIFRPVQSALMAQKAASFISIQLDPAFSTFAQQNLERLYVAYLGEAEAGFRGAWNSVFRPGWELHRPTESIVVFEGGDGRSEEDAVVLKPGDENPETAVAAEYWYLSYVFGRQNSDWRMIRQTLVARENGKKYDDILIELPNGERLSIFFDVTHLNYSREAQERIKARFAVDSFNP